MLVVSPAYGREYKSGKAAKADWDANKDFVIESIGPDVGRMVNKPQVPGKVQIRFAGMRKFVIVDGGKR